MSTSGGRVPRAARAAAPAERRRGAGDVHGLVGSRAERARSAGPRPSPARRRGATPNDVRLPRTIMWSRKQVPSRSRPARRVLDRALGRREPRLDGVGPRPRRRGRRRHGGVLSSGARAAASSHPPSSTVRLHVPAPASSSLLDSSSLAGRRGCRGGSRGGRGSSAVHCIGMRRTNQCVASRPSLVPGKGLSVYLAVFCPNRASYSMLGAKIGFRG